MAPRPRDKRNTGLPPNLYEDRARGSFRYRRPDTGTWHRIGSDRQQAIQAARKLNNLLMEGTDLVAKVMGTSPLLQDFLAVYMGEILPPRELAKATMDLYEIRCRQWTAKAGKKPVDAITIRDCAEMLDSLTPRASNQMRAVMIDVFNHAAAKGLVPDNPAANTIPKIEKKTRKRHTMVGLLAIREASPAWLKNAIDIALITGQRREDILAMKFEHIQEGYLYLVQEKTKKASNAGYLRIKMTPQLKAVVARCRDDVASPFLIHRKPDRLDAKQRESKEHWTQVEERFLSRAFKEARDIAKPYKDWSEAQQPGFHEIRALVEHLYKKAGKNAQQLLGHADEKMTKNYGKDHHDIVWNEVVPEVEVKEITG